MHLYQPPLEDYNFILHHFLKIEKEDILFDLTIIDKNSLDIIAGSTVDFKKELIGCLLYTSDAADDC